MWADHLGGHETSDGFLVLEASDPLRLLQAGNFHGPELYLDAIGARDFFFALSPGLGCKNDEVQRDPGWARFCLADGDASVTVTVQSEDEDEDESLIGSVIADLRVRNITLPR